MWLRGTQSHSAAGFARAVESRAAEIDGFCGRSSFGLTLEAPSAQLEPALDLFAEVLLEPAFDAEEIERERKRHPRRNRAPGGSTLAQRAFLLFAETPLPAPSLPACPPSARPRSSRASTRSTSRRTTSGW